jgi:hypothetical protein
MALTLVQFASDFGLQQLQAERFQIPPAPFIVLLVSACCVCFLPDAVLAFSRA